MPGRGLRPGKEVCRGPGGESRARETQAPGVAVGRGGAGQLSSMSLQECEILDIIMKMCCK